jgi:hypothetical protein
MPRSRAIPTAAAGAQALATPAMAERMRRQDAKMSSLRRAAARKNMGRAGLAALGGLGLAAGARKGMQMAGITEQQLMDKAAYDLQRQVRDAGLASLTNEAQGLSYEDSIQRNLQQIMQRAPDLYMSVAAGRRLPSGAVVLGGAPRQDLLNELGRSMADGRFSQ